MLEAEFPKDADYLRTAINQEYRADEKQLLRARIAQARLTDLQTRAIQDYAGGLIEAVRKAGKKSLGIDVFLAEYSLSTEEGIALMCLAEALLRVPDNATIDDLIRDKLGDADWKSHRGHSDSFFVNAATWALMLTGKVLNPAIGENRLKKALMKMVNRSGQAVIRSAVEKAMHIMSKQFVMGRSIDEALSRAKKKEALGYRYSYDMLGEAALTSNDAERYLEAYHNAIKAIGESVSRDSTVYERPGISIKLSALHPGYQERQHERVLAELAPKLLTLAQAAKSYDIALTIDAEESERLNLSLDVIEKVFRDHSLDGWEGFGVALQSYQKRAYFVLDWLANLARTCKRRMTLRLIKGAYWDSEIKKTQMLGLQDYPVFTSKANTDVSFQACAKKLLTMTDALYPQFATHNAYSVAMILNLAGKYQDFEFQCLHGMGQNLYVRVVALGIPCRIYAPVGSYEDLLPYLVRRILENGANSSFVNRLADDEAPVSVLVADPVSLAEEWLKKDKRKIPLPGMIMPGRKNSRGLDWSDRQQRLHLKAELENLNFSWKAWPLIADKKPEAADQSIFSPQQSDKAIGAVRNAKAEDVKEALLQAELAFKIWSRERVDTRAACLEAFAELLEAHKPEILALLCFEAGKTWNDGLNELREAIDFCYYYARQARDLLQPRVLQGYTGELNVLSLHPRGTILCISPWNFPLAIFTGQIVAALVTGNCVIAKPAEQTPLIAAFATKLLLEAGIPKGVLQLLPGSGEVLGPLLTTDERIKGVIFTGSTATAKMINQSLAGRSGEIIPFIAETGGQNAMLVDSSALLEQVATDVITSAFGSAGQRCSALRVLYLQEDIYQQTLEKLKGAMDELRPGDPVWLTTDIGPVIDAEALQRLQQHVETMEKEAEILYQVALPESCRKGFFMPPTLIAIPNIQSLKKEVFGPILHVISYKKEDLDKVIAEINSTGYGLTFGIHSRINDRVNYIRERIFAGNCYVNRNMIGAVVGLQPFGGEGLSGTGPKAGGPHYLLRLCLERTFTVDTTAAGGNASLMALAE